MTDSTRTKKTAETVPARHKAVEFLARREHSYQELMHKLRTRGYETSEIDEALQQLIARGLQDDERFAEIFVQSRIKRGQGPLKITAELRQRGVADSIIQDKVNAVENDWFDLAYQCYSKKYGTTQVSDYRETSRRLRFLQQRGFDAEQSRAALERT